MYKIEKYIENYEKNERKRILKQLSPIHKEIFNFIKKNKLLIFDTFAFEYWLKDFVPEPPIEQYYYSVYSGNPRKNILELADKLYEAGFKMVEAKKDYTGGQEAYIITYLAYKVIKIYYCPDKLLKIMPNKDLFVDINILKIHTLMAFTQPMACVNRWMELYKYDTLIDEHYPLSIKSIKDTNTGRTPHKILSDVKKILDKHDNILFIGNYAYLEYLKMADYGNYFPKTTTYEILCNDPNKIIEELKNKYKKDLEVKEKRSALHFHKTKYAIKINKIKVLDLYDTEGLCSPTNGKLGTYHLVLLYLYIGWWNSFKMDNKDIRSKLGKMITNLSCARLHYLEKSNKTGIAQYHIVKQSPFDIFQIKCVGQSTDYEKEYKIRKWEGKEPDRLLGIRSYKPEIEKK